MRPLRPFPLPLAVGTDICQISRIFRILAKSQGRRFADRLLTRAEQDRSAKRLQGLERKLKLKLDGGKLESFNTMRTSEPEVWSAAAFLAGRFAAKEAAIKAHPHRHLTFHDISIEPMSSIASSASEDGDEASSTLEEMSEGADVKVRLGSGPPVVRIKAADGEAMDDSAMLSISHDGDYATAVCLGYVGKGHV